MGRVGGETWEAKGEGEVARHGRGRGQPEVNREHARQPADFPARASAQESFQGAWPRAPA